MRSWVQEAGAPQGWQTFIRHVTPHFCYEGQVVRRAVQAPARASWFREWREVGPEISAGVAAVSYYPCMLRPTQSLNLWGKQLGRIPDEVWQQSSLETLVLADNGLSEVSQQIGTLKNLRMLDLGHNHINKLPAALGELDGLTDFLYLHDNRLSSLPAALGRMKKLRYLNISENEFATFPEAICSMESLVELRASDNQLISLPDCIARLERLRELHLRNNKLTSLPDCIGTLQQLRQIDLRGNPINHLPETIAALPRLDKLDLRWVETLPVLPWFATLEARGCVIYR